MANSSLISDLKDKIITEIINDPAFFYAINSPEIKNPQDADQLVGRHIFRYHQNPNTLNQAVTFLTIQVHTEKQNQYDWQSVWIHPKIEIWIISHESCMNTVNLPMVRASRNDYIAQLLDQKFNGRTSIGREEDDFRLNFLGKLDLAENSEGALAPEYLYRKMVFLTRDINHSPCGGR